MGRPPVPSALATQMSLSSSSGEWSPTRTSPNAILVPSGDHVAFRGMDLDGTRQTLRTAGIPFREAVVPRNQSVQIFVHDPDGITLELNFEP